MNQKVETLTRMKLMTNLLLTQKGGEGSGHFGHSGRPGKVGGSAPSGSAPVPSDREKLYAKVKLLAKARELSKPYIKNYDNWDAYERGNHANTKTFWLTSDEKILTSEKYNVHTFTAAQEIVINPDKYDLDLETLRLATKIAVQSKSVDSWDLVENRTIEKVLEATGAIRVRYWGDSRRVSVSLGSDSLTMGNIKWVQRMIENK